MIHVPTETISYYILVQYGDLLGEAYESTFWTIMKRQEFAKLQFGDGCYLEDDFYFYCVVEFHFHSDREVKVFKLKHPNEYDVISSNYELYKQNKHRIDVCS